VSGTGPARAEAIRRRRIALASVAMVALIIGVIVGSEGGRGGDGGGSAPVADAAPSCPEAVATSPARLAGQKVIARMEAVATDSLRRRLADGELGGVILFPPEGTSPDGLAAQVSRLRAVAERAGMPAPLVMIDQEGGDVARLPSLPPSGSAATIGRQGAERAAQEGSATGEALAGLGVDVNLAPVMDLAGPVLGSRAFGGDPERVAELGVAFGTSMQAAGVAATAKHFPGLGSATVNTDTEPSAVELPPAALERALVPFRAAVDSGFDLVMVANATYPGLDSGRPASISPKVIDGLLRGDLGYGGVVITDDLDAGALTGAAIPEGDAAVGAAGAGADLILTALSSGEEAQSALVGAIRDRSLPRRAMLESCARTTALRARLAS
jgi:beta-N-acetylhexosaminidase